MSYREIDPNLAGIYIIKNIINNKCYVGQSVNLRNRIKDHMRNAKNLKVDIPIYRAIKKYGFYNFTIDIIESFTRDPNMSNDELIRILDEKEVYYIDKYKAYTEGYNCTIGGDYGVLGLKLTEPQRKKASENAKELVSKGVIGKRVYMYNFIERYYITAWTVKDAANITKVSRSNISRLCNNKYIKPYCSNFIAAFSVDELEEKKKSCLTYVTNVKTANSTRNSHWHKGKELSEEQKDKIRCSNIKYTVYQYNLTGTLISTYNGIGEAANAINVDYKSIQRVCCGRAKTCKGYVWKKELKQSDCKQTVNN